MRNPVFLIIFILLLNVLSLYTFRSVLVIHLLNHSDVLGNDQVRDYFQVFIAITMYLPIIGAIWADRSSSLLTPVIAGLGFMLIGAALCITADSSVLLWSSMLLFAIGVSFQKPALFAALFKACQFSNVNFNLAYVIFVFLSNLVAFGAPFLSTLNEPQPGGYNVNMVLYIVIGVILLTLVLALFARKQLTGYVDLVAAAGDSRTKSIVVWGIAGLVIFLALNLIPEVEPSGLDDQIISVVAALSMTFLLWPLAFFRSIKANLAYVIAVTIIASSALLIFYGGNMPFLVSQLSGLPLTVLGTLWFIIIMRLARSNRKATTIALFMLLNSLINSGINWGMGKLILTENFLPIITVISLAVTIGVLIFLWMRPFSDAEREILNTPKRTIQ